MLPVNRSKKGGFGEYVRGFVWLYRVWNVGKINRI